MADERILTSEGWQPYTAPPPQPEEDFSLNPRGVERLFQEQPVDVAIKAIEAAIQFQGLRGYQQALQSGQPAEKAMAKFGPMIFRKTPGAMGSAIRAMTPVQPRPLNELDQARIRELDRRAPKVASPFPELNFKAKQLADEEGSIMRKYPGPLALTISPEDKAAIADIQKRRKELQPPAAVAPAPSPATVTPPATATAAPPPIAQPRTLAEANAMSRFGRGGSGQPFVYIGGNRAPVAAAAPARAAAPSAAPINRSDRVEGKPYQLPNGKIGTWTKEGWKVE